jgi:hypothetical protein
MSSLFTLSEDGRLRLSDHGELANIGGCYISGANFSCDTNRLSGWIEFPHPTKKELDFNGAVVYEKSVMESICFYVDDFSGGIIDEIIKHLNAGGYFYLKSELFDKWTKTKP